MTTEEQYNLAAGYPADRKSCFGCEYRDIREYHGFLDNHCRLMKAITDPFGCCTHYKRKEDKDG